MDFNAKNVVVTGNFNTISRSELKVKLKDLGAIVSSSVSLKTDFVISGEDAGNKLDKAKLLGLEVLSEDEFMAAISDLNQSSVQAPVDPSFMSKDLSEKELGEIFPNSTRAGSSFKSETKLTRSLCENGEALNETSLESILNSHLKALESFNGGSWQTLDVSGMVMAILSGGSQDLASFSNKQISAEVKLLDKDLRYCNFCSSLAESVDFENSNLENAIFTDSFMKDVSFKNCNMASVDFSRADLRNASFENANLEYCDFENANLEGANFKGATGLDSATFPGAKLKGIII